MLPWRNVIDKWVSYKLEALVFGCAISQNVNFPRISANFFLDHFYCNKRTVLFFGTVVVGLNFLQETYKVFPSHCWASRRGCVTAMWHVFWFLQICTNVRVVVHCNDHKLVLVDLHCDPEVTSIGLCQIGPFQYQIHSFTCWSFLEVYFPINAKQKWMVSVRDTVMVPLRKTLVLWVRETLKFTSEVIWI